MDKEMKVLRRNNIIKFVIGMILLGFCAGYLSNHPSEKASIFSGFEVLFQRGEVYVSSLINKENGDVLKSKFDWEKTYEELILLADHNTCLQEGLAQEIRETLKSLQKEESKNLASTMPGYIRKANEYGMKVREKCDK